MKMSLYKKNAYNFFTNKKNAYKTLFRIYLNGPGYFYIKIQTLFYSRFLF
jgi:hypothetical protein